MEAFDLLRYWHERAPVDIKRHFENVTEAELATRPTTKAVDLAALSENHSVDVATRGMGELQKFECLKEMELDIKRQ